MAPSLKSASTVILLAIPSIVTATGPTCTLKDLAPAGSTCGTYGVITKFEYFIEDLYDAQYTSVLSCASECAKRSNCKSFNIRTEQDAFCELQSATQKQAGFVPDNVANRSASSYQGFDLFCFDSVNDPSQGQSSDFSSSSTDTSTGSQISSQGTTSSSSSTQGTTSTTFSSNGIAQRTTSSTTLTSSSSSSASPTTTPYVCNEDNCYRALLRFGDQAKGFCSGYTTVTNAETASVPAYLDNCSSKPAMISSGCSCLATWISPDPEPTLPNSAESLTSATGYQSSVISSPTSAMSDSASSSVSSPSATTTTGSFSSIAGNSTTGISQSTIASVSSTITASPSHTQDNRNANSTSAFSSASTQDANTTVPLSSIWVSTTPDVSPVTPTTPSSDPSTSTLIRELAVPTTTTKSVTEFMISTVYATSVHTFKECPPTEKTCHVGLVTTTLVSVTTTLAPIIKVVVPTPTIDFIPPGYAVEPIYKVHVDIVNIPCPPAVYDCPVEQIITRTIEAGSAVCPCPTSDAQVYYEEHREIVCYQAQVPGPAPEVNAAALPMYEASQELGAVPMPVEARPAPPAMTPPSMVTITSIDKTSTKTMTYPIDQLPPPPCGLSLDAFDHKEEAYWAYCPDYSSTTAPMPQPGNPTPVNMDKLTMVTITSKDKTSTKTMTYHIDNLPPPPCGLRLDAFDYKEEAYWAECPDYTSTTTPMPKPTAVNKSPSFVTVTSSDKSSTKTMTYPIDNLPPPPCGLSLDAFDHKEEAYWAHCPDYTSPTPSPETPTSTISLITLTLTDASTTRTITTTPNPAFDYHEEAFWTHPSSPRGSPWSLPPPGTDTPSVVKMATTGPAWWTLPPVATAGLGSEKKPMVSGSPLPLPPSVEKVSMKEGKNKKKKSAGNGLGAAGNLSLMLAAVASVVVYLL
ncbi:hypothetical protein ONS95_006421 [Cadophora gregata]|uniref:uncharacterized protein n=1 Tax=Cadophora gregata TaxID=51156 RepID=UPI0026DB943A|nr:uncharacterized protein ONS95_006421 [Cadophora gregata]KAK0101242.1 hypothetical protein ONS95_006421 [Cadophora gregata]